VHESIIIVNEHDKDEDVVVGGGVFERQKILRFNLQLFHCGKYKHR
jgi:hypothetical protein